MVRLACLEGRLCGIQERNDLLPKAPALVIMVVAGNILPVWVEVYTAPDLTTEILV